MVPKVVSIFAMVSQNMSQNASLLAYYGYIQHNTLFILFCITKFIMLLKLGATISHWEEILLKFLNIREIGALSEMLFSAFGSLNVRWIS